MAVVAECPESDLISAATASEGDWVKLLAAASDNVGG